jgi:hypothetical protein
VWIDGEEAGLAPVTKEDVPAGSHLVEARAEGYAKASAEAEVRRGETAVVRLSLADATREARGTVRVVASVKDAMASIDGGEPQPVPLVRDDITAGTHFVIVTAPGYAEWKKSVAVTPGGIVEVVADLGTAGRLEVSTKGNAPAEVFLNGKLLGPAPLKTDVATGTYRLTIKRADGKLEEHDIAIGTGSAVKIDAKFNEQRSRVRHRAMPWSAQAIDKGYGTVDIGLSWPYLVVARVNGGVWRNMDIGVTWRSALDTINEVELRVKYQVARSRAFAFGAEAALVFGFGSDSRNTIGTRITTLSSILIGEKVAATARIGARIFSDRVEPKDIQSKRDNGAQFQAGLSLEIRLSKHINFMLLFEGEPFGEKRALLRKGVFKKTKDIGIWAASGISVLF